MIIERDFYRLKKFPPHGNLTDKLIAGGYIQRLASGLFVIMPLGQMITGRISEYIREAVEKIGFERIGLPILQPKSLWEASGRWDKYGENMFEIGEFVLSPTSEEVILEMAQFTPHPWKVYDISERVRNTSRPAYGLMRSLNFLLAEFYCVGDSESEAIRLADELEDAYLGIFRQMGLNIIPATYLGREHTLSFVISNDTDETLAQCVAYACTGCGSHYRVASGRASPETCPKCGAKLSPFKTVEVGDIAYLGDQFPSKYLTVGGIGVSRLLQIIAAQSVTETGFVWPDELTPYQVEIVASSKRELAAIAAYRYLNQRGMRVLLDLRPISFGRKFTDADLIGAPLRLVYGEKTSGKTYEFLDRRSGEARMLQYIQDLLKEGE